MNTTLPTISVICPTYNSEKYVSDTIRSVLNQATPPFELIVSDDGSTDETLKVVERMTKDALFTVRVLKNPHQGPGAARNAGIRAAQGEWIAFLDSDDRWHTGKIAHVLEAITEHPEVNFFCHDQCHRFLDGREVPLHLPKRYQGMVIARQLFRNCPFATSAVVCRKDLLVGHGMFNERLMSAQDFELWLRLIPQLRVYFIDEVLGTYCDRSGNISSTKRWQHFRNQLWALSKNKRNTKMSWYMFGMVRHVAIFAKNQLLRFL